MYRIMWERNTGDFNNYGCCKARVQIFWIYYVTYKHGIRIILYWMICMYVCMFWDYKVTPNNLCSYTCTCTWVCILWYRKGRNTLARYNLAAMYSYTCTHVHAKQFYHARQEYIWQLDERNISYDKNTESLPVVHRHEVGNVILSIFKIA